VQIDYFSDYCQQGKRAYYIASTLCTDDNADEGAVLERLSHDFELCAYGLNEVRREWEHKDPPAEGGDASRPYLIE
jgi:hypothetical protein